MNKNDNLWIVVVSDCDPGHACDYISEHLSDIKVFGPFYSKDEAGKCMTDKIMRIVNKNAEDGQTFKDIKDIVENGKGDYDITEWTDGNGWNLAEYFTNGNHIYSISVHKL